MTSPVDQYNQLTSEYKELDDQASKLEKQIEGLNESLLKPCSSKKQLQWCEKSLVNLGLLARHEVTKFEDHTPERTPSKEESSLLSASTELISEAGITESDVEKLQKDICDLKKEIKDLTRREKELNGQVADSILKAAKIEALIKEREALFFPPEVHQAYALFKAGKCEEANELLNKFT